MSAYDPKRTSAGWVHCTVASTMIAPDHGLGGNEASRIHHSGRWCRRLVARRARRAGDASRIGFLRVGPPPPTYIGGFREGLQEQGLVEGRDFVIEYALAQSAVQISETAIQLARAKPDIILAAGTPSVFPARDATGHIPVVFVATFDGSLKRNPRSSARRRPNVR